MPEFVIESENIDGCYNKLIICNTETGEIINTFDTVADFGTDIIADNGNIVFQDVNFDGFMDIDIFTGYAGNWRTDHIYYVWLEADFAFTPDPYDLRSLGLPYFDTENQTIKSVDRGSAADHWFYEHEYFNDKLVNTWELSYTGVYIPDEQSEIALEKAEGLLTDDFDPTFFLRFKEFKLDEATMEMIVVKDIYCTGFSENAEGIIPTGEISLDSELGKFLSNYSAS